MSVVKINAIEVTPGMGPALEERFAKRASEVEKMPGFEGFELLRPSEGDTYYVYTRWESEQAFQAWVESPAFTRGHAQASRDSGKAPVSHASALLSFEVVQKVTSSEDRRLR